jgi:hypothetical protein
MKDYYPWIWTAGTISFSLPSLLALDMGFWFRIESLVLAFLSSSRHLPGPKLAAGTRLYEIYWDVINSRKIRVQASTTAQTVWPGCVHHPA